MNERDIRLLFDAGHWSGASVTFVANDNAWLIYLNVIDKHEQVTLTLKSGSPRYFKTSDTAINWCHEIGFKKISVHLSSGSQSLNSGQNKALQVVLIEDNHSDIELTLRAFQKLNAHISVMVFQDGEEALEFFHAKGKYEARESTELPRIILLDLKLPKLNGHEVLKEIRANENTAQIPVVIFSTSSENIDVDLSYKLGSNSYIQKPVSYDEFNKAIEKIGSYWLNYNTSLLNQPDYN